MSKIRVTELDFQQIKENFKNYLRGKPEFNDYDFDGAGISVLMDLLAYNTVYNSFYTNMVAAEMFLDTAQLRESVVSNAKHLKYVPTSVRSARAILKLVFTPTTSPARITIPKRTPFFVTGPDSRTYTFLTTETRIAFPNINGEYIIEDLDVIEGKAFTHKYVVDYGGPDAPRFILPNPSVDTSFMDVYVQTSESNSFQEIYKLAEDINELTGEDAVYFLKEIEGELFEVYFGDDVIGKEPDDGNVVFVDYITSSGPLLNGVSNFSSEEGIDGIPKEEFTIEVIQKALGGAEIETIDSIKLLAPENWEAQNRAVTQTDYETLIKKDFSQIEFARVWGGEDNDPPQYGRVFISLKPTEGLVLSQEEKLTIINQIVKTRNMVAMELVLIEPIFVLIVPEVTVYFRSTNTNKTEDEIKQEVISTIQNYQDTELAGFDTKFRYSKLLRDVDLVDDSIQNSSIDISLKQRIIPQLGIPTKFEIPFNNELDRGDSTNNVSTLSSSAFTYKGATSYLGDDGQGDVYIYRVVNGLRVIFERQVGSIDYDAGKIILNAFAPETIIDDLNTIDVIVTPKAKNLLSIRNQILVIEDKDITVNMVDESLEVIE